MIELLNLSIHTFQRKNFFIFWDRIFFVFVIKLTLILFIRKILIFYLIIKISNLKEK